MNKEAQITNIRRGITHLEGISTSISAGNFEARGERYKLDKTTLASHIESAKRISSLKERVDDGIFQLASKIETIELDSVMKREEMDNARQSISSLNLPELLRDQLKAHFEQEFGEPFEKVSEQDVQTDKTDKSDPVVRTQPVPSSKTNTVVIYKGVELSVRSLTGQIIPMVAENADITSREIADRLGVNPKSAARALSVAKDYIRVIDNSKTEDLQTDVQEDDIKNEKPQEVKQEAAPARKDRKFVWVKFPDGSIERIDERVNGSLRLILEGKTVKTTLQNARSLRRAKLIISRHELTSISSLSYIVRTREEIQRNSELDYLAKLPRLDSLFVFGKTGKEIIASFGKTSDEIDYTWIQAFRSLNRMFHRLNARIEKGIEISDHEREILNKINQVINPTNEPGKTIERFEEFAKARLKDQPLPEWADLIRYDASEEKAQEVVSPKIEEVKDASPAVQAAQTRNDVVTLKPSEPTIIALPKTAAPTTLPIEPSHRKRKPSIESMYPGIGRIITSSVHLVLEKKLSDYTALQLNGVLGISNRDSRNLVNRGFVKPGPGNDGSPLFTPEEAAVLHVVKKYGKDRVSTKFLDDLVKAVKSEFEQTKDRNGVNGVDHSS